MQKGFNAIEEMLFRVNFAFNIRERAMGQLKGKSLNEEQKRKINNHGLTPMVLS